MKKKKRSTPGVSEQRLRAYPVILCLTALIVAMVVMVVGESDFLFRVEEMNLFLDTPLFFRQQMVVSGGMLTWISTYFTQFFYHPVLGAALLCGWCALLMWLVASVFRITPRWAPVLLLPLALILLSDFTQGYWIFFQKLRGLMFSTVIGFSLATALVGIYRRLPPKLLLRPLFMVFTALAFYPLAGFYGLAAVALMAIIDWRLKGTSLTQRLTDSAVAAAVLIAVPLFYYRYVFCQTNITDIWLTALPMYKYSDGSYPIYHLPWMLLALLLAILAATYAHREPGELKKPWHWAAAHVVAVAAIAVGCWHFWYKDANFHYELRMNACIDKCDWQGVLDIAPDCETPSRQMVLFRYLSFFKLGRAGNDMYTLRDGDAPGKHPFHTPIIETGGKALYLHYGLQNYCHRWCMEDGVERGFRTEELKYLLRCAVLNGEHQVARKYINLLKHTRYYGEWAAHYEPMLTDSAALKADKELGPVLHLMKYENTLASDKSIIETFLVELLSHRQTDDLVCADLVLMHALQSKDIPTFWRAFFQYANLHKDDKLPMPRHYQEAALLYGNLEHNVDISHMPFDKDVKQKYQDFMQSAQQFKGMSEEQMAKAMFLRYGDTFYYNYFLRRGVKTY